MVHITSTSLCLSEDTKALKEYHDKFSQKMDDKENKRTSFTTSYDELLQNTSTNDRLGNKINAEISELEATIEMKLDNIIAENKRILEFLRHENISSHFRQTGITSEKQYSHIKILF